MNRSNQEKFLRDVLADEALEQARAAALTRGLEAIRARKRRRSLVAAVGGLALVVAVLTAVSRRPAGFEPPHVASPPAVQLKIITDEQLVALFPNRPTALIGAPGEQRLLFLDEPRGEATAR